MSSTLGWNELLLHFYKVPMSYRLHFAANLSWLFPELEKLSHRIEAAAQAGFKAVEVAWPYDTDVTELKQALEKNGVDLILINTPPGNKAKGELGLGAVPMQEAEFRAGLDLAVKYAKTVGCKQIHLMAGRVPVGLDRTSVAKEMEATFIENLKYAADILSKEGLLGLVEPINTRITDPRYFLSTPHQAVRILQQVDRPNLKLQLDLFHCQIMDGNLTQNITNYFPLIGHVQIAQVPNRNEADSPGEISYSYIFSLLEKLGYPGYVGCEYTPKGNTVDGLGWLRSYWRNQGTKKLADLAECQ
ncbi:putative hydroxypyruvate isomerase isoform X1 [Scyliorhinus canicula]|uniref:putative hydroxypyruvate isomerase isoform X1 n=2 Tax=Scyliorhinus canicula TaxID=7830 RepID=UPI0018F3968F|nr:putative hydroxypyruvate isomerase isoform X1 [Scyliorhinus canicula]